MLKDKNVGRETTKEKEMINGTQSENYHLSEKGVIMFHFHIASDNQGYQHSVSLCLKPVMNFM